MNAIAYLDRNETDSLSRSGPDFLSHPLERADKLQPARGMILGLAISVGFWLAVGVGAYLLFGR